MLQRLDWFLLRLSGSRQAHCCGAKNLKCIVDRVNSLTRSSSLLFLASRGSMYLTTRNANRVVRHPALAVPHLSLAHIGHLDFEGLRAMGCKGIVFDKVRRGEGLVRCLPLANAGYRLQQSCRSVYRLVWRGEEYRGDCPPAIHGRLLPTWFLSGTAVLLPR